MLTLIASRHAKRRKSCLSSQDIVGQNEGGGGQGRRNINVLDFLYFSKVSIGPVICLCLF